MIKTTMTAIAATLIAGAAAAENVEIYLVDILDNIQDGYCLDIAKGRGADANPDDGLQAHTCYSPSGEVLVDQAFDPDQFADGVLYMPEFDVCMVADSVTPGASPTLSDCDGSDAQAWVFTGEGTITPASATDLCITASGDTSTGRSDENQMKSLTLAICSGEDSGIQTWANRTAE